MFAWGPGVQCTPITLIYDHPYHTPCHTLIYDHPRPIPLPILSHYSPTQPAKLCTNNSCRLICMLVLTMSFFVVEIVVGYMTGSLALIGDSYHMLSDVVALLVGIVSLWLSQWPSNNKHTYGWARAEVSDT